MPSHRSWNKRQSGQLRLEQGGLYDEQGELITQAGHDSKVILLIGSWKQLERPGVSAQEKAIKTKTLELFRRDSRNIKILTYDERVAQRHCNKPESRLCEG